MDVYRSTLHEGKGIVCPAGGVPEPTKSSRGRRKQQWKLKFHHQALPPEYLDHYEASLNKSRPSMATTSTTGSASQQASRNSANTEIKPNTLYEANHLPNESIHNWLQRITNIQNEIQKSTTSAVASPTPSSTTTSSPSTRRRRAPAVVSPCTSSKVLNYRDLPYMGEMTLNNSKPRRGRKPKKADICHLIYKNYGTIFPGTPSHLVDERLSSTSTTFDKSAPIKQERLDRGDAILAPSKQRTDLQNKIISSLLEKRLSQETKKHKDGKGKKTKSVQMEECDSPSPSPPSDAEPLNLCVRDLNNLKIRLLRKHGNVYAKAVETKMEPPDVPDDELEPECNIEEVVPSTSELCLSPTLKMNMPDFKKALQEATSSSDTTSTLEKHDEAESPLPGGYVYWPNAGVFVHPLALQSQLLYYQGLAAGNTYIVPPAKSPAPTTPGTITPAPEVEPQPSPTGSSDSSTPSAASTRAKRASNQGNSTPAPTKRKRSAIFIPPVANDTSSSPATEVSICKFKFTGGARPSLQEKKMLSVDSGGNFRYYSGTGDKASRGYEFFPRESLQQAGGGGPLTATPAPAPPTTSTSSNDTTKRKRKSRKSLQREKLEQTFKEKGFLIQTQQLESAEGATYCKFRQLRKFTRYLFRSWKDYLPGAINNETDSTPALPPTPVQTKENNWS